MMKETSSAKTQEVWAKLEEERKGVVVPLPKTVLNVSPLIKISSALYQSLERRRDSLLL